jgi:hypothetical protein
MGLRIFISLLSLSKLDLYISYSSLFVNNKLNKKSLDRDNWAIKLSGESK